MILPGEVIGILGGGQLGRMLAQSAATLGYRVHIYDPTAGGPAAEVAGRETNADFADEVALEKFADAVDVVTYEFENIPVAGLEKIVARVPLRPPVEALHVCQNRQREKAWLKKNGFPHVRYAEALDGDILRAVKEVGRPCVVKTADFGYDGKGQMKIASDQDLEQAAAIFRGRRCVVEQWCEFQCELSVIVARTLDGNAQAFPAVENIHRNHILECTLAPGRFSRAADQQARKIAECLSAKLGVVGLLAVEFFLTLSGELLINELAPRPHNSGHWTLEGCETSQFEQHVRAVCGLPLGGVEIRQPTVMINILGDSWETPREGNGVPPNWVPILAEAGAKLHLYGKREARPGRKMGHFTVCDPAGVEAALARARLLQAKLRQRHPSAGTS